MTLTKLDIEQIKEIVEKIVEAKISKLRTELLNKFDEIIGMFKGNQEDHEILVEKNRNYEERIETLEKIHPQSQHQAA